MWLGKMYKTLLKFTFKYKSQRILSQQIKNNHKLKIIRDIRHEIYIIKSQLKGKPQEAKTERQLRGAGKTVYMKDRQLGVASHVN